VTLTDVPPGLVRIQFQPDSRPLSRIDQSANNHAGQSLDAVIARHRPSIDESGASS